MKITVFIISAFGFFMGMLVTLMIGLEYLWGRSLEGSLADAWGPPGEMSWMLKIIGGAGFFLVLLWDERKKLLPPKELE